MFGQLAGRSVFNTPTGFTHFRPIFGLLFENVIFGLLFENVQGRSGRTRFGNRARVVGLARCSPTMRTPSPTTKLLAGMLASEAAAERVLTEHQLQSVCALNTNFGCPGGAFFGARRLNTMCWHWILRRLRLRHEGVFSEEVNGLGATAAAARLSSRAGRPKPRHAKDGAAILRVLGRRGGPEGRLSVVR